MEVRAARRVTDGQDRAALKVYNRRGGGYSNSNVCVFWLAGRCNRNPCRFLHGDSPPVTYNRNSNQCRVSLEDSQNGSSRLKPKGSLVSMSNDGGSGVRNTQNNHEQVIQKNIDMVCDYWLSSNCVYGGDKCRYLHSWFRGDGFTRLTQLEGHKKAITGIALPSGSDKLYSGCSDGTVRVWDCNTGQCAKVINLGGEVRSLISEGPWVFVGMQNVVKAWNIHTCAEHSLTGPVGQVYAMIVGKDTLFAGAQGVLALCGVHDSESKPILFCSCNDNSVRLYDLPSFSDRGRLFAKKEVRAIQIGPGGLFFTGDGTGRVAVWKWLAEPSA